MCRRNVLKAGFLVGKEHYLGNTEQLGFDGMVTDPTEKVLW